MPFGMARTRREQAPATAQPTRWASQWKLPVVQKVDWSTAWVLSDGQPISVKGDGMSLSQGIW